MAPNNLINFFIWLLIFAFVVWAVVQVAAYLAIPGIFVTIFLALAGIIFLIQILSLLGWVTSPWGGPPVQR